MAHVHRSVHVVPRYTIQFKDISPPTRYDYSFNFNYLCNRNTVFCFIDRPLLWEGGEILKVTLDFDDVDKFFTSINEDDLPPFLCRMHFLIPPYSSNLIEFMHLKIERKFANPRNAIVTFFVKNISLVYSYFRENEAIFLLQKLQ